MSLRRATFLAGLLACLLGSLVSVPAHAEAPVGFLHDYSTLTPVSGKPSLLTYINRSAGQGRYSTLYFAPPEIVVSRDDEASAIELPAQTRQRMAGLFGNAFRHALGSDYTVTDTPGPDVLTVRLAITGVQAARSDLQSDDFLPLRLAFQVARAAAGLAPKVVEMAGEMEVLAPDGTVLLAATATRKGEAELAQADRVTWPEMEPILHAWAQGFRRLLDELRSPPIPGSVKN